MPDTDELLTPFFPYSVLTAGGRPTHVMVPVADYMAFFPHADLPVELSTPAEVLAAVAEGMTPLRAWREYLHLTQEAVARRMGITAPAFMQMEKSARPHRATLEKVATALAIPLSPLLDMYDR